MEADKEESGGTVRSNQAHCGFICHSPRQHRLCSDTWYQSELMTHQPQLTARKTNSGPRKAQPASSSATQAPIVESRELSTQIRVSPPVQMVTPLSFPLHFPYSLFSHRP